MDYNELFKTIPLNRLELSDANVRTTAGSKQKFDELKASLAAHGVIGNLVVRIRSNTATGGVEYTVVAGGRRLAALKALAAEGRIPTDDPVPCRLARGSDSDHELSLAENTAREQMHPVDEVEAFSRLAADRKNTAETIAERFGVSTRTVHQRLRVAGVAPEILQACRDGRITMEVVAAFAATTDQGRQRRVWTMLQNQADAGGHEAAPNAAWVRHEIGNGMTTMADGLARFVGLDDYEAAGGRTQRDLFAADDARGVTLLDKDVLDRLAREKLDAAAADIAPHWKWVETAIEVDYNRLHEYGAVHGKPSEPSPEEQARLDEIEDRLAAIEQADDSGQPTDADADETARECAALEEELWRIDRRREQNRTYTDADRASSGCIVTIDYAGELDVRRGLVRPEDAPNHGEAADGSVGDDGYVAPLKDRQQVDPDKKARSEAGMTRALVDDLRCVRSNIVKAHLANDFDLAVELAAFHFARSVFGTGSAHGRTAAIDVRKTAERPSGQRRDNDWPEGFRSGERLLAANRRTLALNWLGEDDRAAQYKAFSRLTEKQKKRLFAAAFARTIEPQLAFEPDAAARPELEEAIVRLNVPFAARFRPAADTYWKRIRKDDALQIARDVLGDAWADAHAGDRKTDLAEALEAVFASKGTRPVDVNAAQKQAVDAWTPPGFPAFDDRKAHASTDRARSDGADVPAPPAPENRKRHSTRRGNGADIGDQRTRTSKTKNTATDENAAMDAETIEPFDATPAASLPAFLQFESGPERE